MDRSPFVPERLVDHSEVLSADRIRRKKRKKMLALAKKVESGEGTIGNVGTLLHYIIKYQK